MECPSRPTAQVVPGCEGRDQRGVTFVPNVAKSLGIPAQEYARSDSQNDGGGKISVSGQPYDVIVPTPKPLHPLLSRQSIEAREDVAETGGPLEFQRLRGLLHESLYPAPHTLGVTVQNLENFPDHLTVRGLILQIDARGQAPPNVIIEAGTVRCLSRKIVTAGAYGIESLDHVESVTHQSHRRVGSEVSRSVVVELPSHEDSRKRLHRGDFDVGVTLVVPELNVEPWLVFLDQVRFEDQGFRFRPHDDRLQRHDVPHHFLGLRGLARRPKIAPYPRS